MKLDDFKRNEMNYYTIPAAVLLFLATFTSLSAQNAVILQDSESEYFLNDYLEIFEDEFKKYSLKDISSRSFTDSFKINKDSYPYAKNKTSAYWIRIYLHNRANLRKKWVFEVLSLHTQNLEFFIPDGGKFLMYKTGQNFDFDQREYKVKNFIFDISSLHQGIYPIYLRVESDNEASFEYKIRSQHYFTKYSTKEYYFLGLYYGILTFLVVYTLLLFITSKEKSYLFYILYVLICVLISLEGDGLGFQFLWPSMPEVNKWVSSYWVWVLFLVSFIIYSRYFIDERFNFPYFNYLLVGSLVFDVFIELTLLLPDIVITYFFLVPIIIIYCNAVYGYLKGATANRFFILGQSFLLLSLIITRSSWYGFLPSNIFTVYSFNYGVLLESVVFSYAFIDKYTIIKKEKEKAQSDIIQQLEENKDLQTKVNRELEKKVEERTLLLQKEKEKLKEANSKLEILMAEVNKMNSKLDYENWHLNKKVTEETKARIVAKEVSLEEFFKIFPTELACLKYLEELKWGNGYKCKKCGNAKYIDLNKLLSRRCTKCTYIESVTNSTLFHSLRFPIQKAFYIVYHCSFSGGKMTIDELSFVLDLRRNTCWNFKKKVLERIEENRKLNKDMKKWEALILD